MPSITTNIYKELNKKDKNELKKFDKQFGKIEFYEPIEKGVEAVEFVRFIFDGFNVKDFLRDNLLWEALTGLGVVLYGVAKRKRRNQEIHFWIKDLSGNFPINLAFSAKNKREINKIMSQARRAIQKSLKKYKPKKKEIVWISYDPQTDTWKTKVF